MVGDVARAPRLNRRDVLREVAARSSPAASLLPTRRAARTPSDASAQRERGGSTNTSVSAPTKLIDAEHDHADRRWRASARSRTVSTSTAVTITLPTIDVDRGQRVEAQRAAAIARGSRAGRSRQVQRSCHTKLTRIAASTRDRRRGEVVHAEHVASSADDRDLNDEAAGAGDRESQEAPARRSRVDRRTAWLIGVSPRCRARERSAPTRSTNVHDHADGADHAAKIPETHRAQAERSTVGVLIERERAGRQQDAQLGRADADERHLEHAPGVRREIGLRRDQEERRHHERGDHRRHVARRASPANSSAVPARSIT